MAEIPGGGPEFAGAEKYTEEFTDGAGRRITLTTELTLYLDTPAIDITGAWSKGDHGGRLSGWQRLSYGRIVTQVTASGEGLKFTFSKTTEAATTEDDGRAVRRSAVSSALHGWEHTLRSRQASAG